MNDGGGGMGSLVQFRALVSYVQPTFDELRRWFMGGVDPRFHMCELVEIDLCKQASREDREMTFEYVHLAREAEVGDVLAEMKHRALRPARYEEHLGFLKQHPSEQMQFPIAALGSTRDPGRNNRLVPYAWKCYEAPCLNMYLVDSGWADYYRFLAVREAA